MFGDLVDTSTSLAATVEHLTSLDPMPDVVLATGDLTDEGTQAEYSLLTNLLAPIANRLLPLPGNHDNGPLFRSAFANQLPENTNDDHCSYVVDKHPIRMVGLDTSLPGRHDGRFDDTHEEWLNSTLSSCPNRTTLVFTHFPPFISGINFMDLAGLEGAERLRSVIASHPQVKLLVAGHLHRAIHTTVSNTLVSVCPSTGNQLGLDLHPDRGFAVNEPPGYQLHRWDGERFVTHTGVVWDGKRIDLAQFVASVRHRAEQGKPFLKN